MSRQARIGAKSDERWATGLVCSATGASLPLDEPHFLSPAGKPLLVRYELDRERGRQLRRRLADRPWTLWRYRELLPVRDASGIVDLGEGGTPLVRVRRLFGGADVWVKEEGGNPSGSFKARGLSVAVNRARELGAPGLQLPSAGNAALALATYCAASAMPCRVAMPEDTPATVMRRCRELGAEVLTCAGTLVDAGALLAERDDGYWSLATLREPYRVEGKKTMGLELAEQLGWRLPDWILYPTGGGTGIVGMHKAFAELEELGLVSGPRPRFGVVQMAGCAPLVRAFEAGAAAAEPWPDAATRVWGLRVPQAIGDFLVLEALRHTGGAAVAVAEEAVAGMQLRAAREEGMIVGPEGAAALLACAGLIEEGRIDIGDRVVVFQTGHPANYE
ncbi:MAG: threonine synthase [Thermoanaerobaculia bacterium]|nr:threonine synthase [Thermoanaerobaculia bacterium]